MNKSLNTVVAVMLLGLLPVLCIYAGVQGQEYTEGEAVKVATIFLKGSPTYMFDGIGDTVELVRVEAAGSPYAWYVTLRFTSRNAGYGDRAGKMVATVLTGHTTVILVSGGRVVFAVTDERFDEVNGEMIEASNPSSEAGMVAVEWLRDAFTFGFDGVGGAVAVVDVVILEGCPEQYVITVRFSCVHPGYGDRTGVVLAQVVTGHTAVVVVSGGEVLGAVVDGEWDEFNQRERVVSEILSPEEAVDMVIRYLKERYMEASGLNMGDDWSVVETCPEGLLGASSFEYSGDGWRIKVIHPVVWEPTYTLEVVNNQSGFTWSGTINQSGTVNENTG